MKKSLYIRKRALTRNLKIALKRALYISKMAREKCKRLLTRAPSVGETYVRETFQKRGLYMRKRAVNRAKCMIYLIKEPLK